MEAEGNVQKKGGEDEGLIDPYNVKHLTCYFWDSQGWCKWGPRCRYAHKHTGRVAKAPIVKDNGRSVAGRNASLEQPTFRRWQGLAIDEQPERNHRFNHERRRSRSPEKALETQFDASRSRSRLNYSPDSVRNSAVPRYDAASASPQQTLLLREVSNSARNTTSRKQKMEYSPSRPFVELKDNPSGPQSYTSRPDSQPPGCDLYPQTEEYKPSQSLHPTIADGKAMISSEMPLGVLPERTQTPAIARSPISAAALNNLTSALVEQQYPPSQSYPHYHATSTSTIIPIQIGDLNELYTSRQKMQKQIDDQHALLVKARELFESGSKVLKDEGQLAMELCQKLQRGEQLDPDTVADAWLSATHMLDQARGFQVELHQWAQVFSDENRQSVTPVHNPTEIQLYQPHLRGRGEQYSYSEQYDPGPYHNPQVQIGYRNEVDQQWREYPNPPYYPAPHTPIAGVGSGSGPRSWPYPGPHPGPHIPGPHPSGPHPGSQSGAYPNPQPVYHLNSQLPPDSHLGPEASIYGHGGPY